MAQALVHAPARDVLVQLQFPLAYLERSGMKVKVKKQVCEHDYKPNGMTIEYFQWKCSKCGHETESHRGHQ